MYITQVELEFVEMPSEPELQPSGIPLGVRHLDIAPGVQPTFLLSMWDTSCKLAQWDGTTHTFQDGGGSLNPLAIRAWAALPRPLDFPGWGPDVAAAAMSRDADRADAGWLEPLYR